MVFEFFAEVVEVLHGALILSDAAFNNLLGVLCVVAFLRVYLPVHGMMTQALSEQNIIVVLAEADGCTEFDVFCRALEWYCGQPHEKKAEKDFVHYLCGRPEEYTFPLYVRQYLEMRAAEDEVPDRLRKPVPAGLGNKKVDSAAAKC